MSGGDGIKIALGKGLPMHPISMFLFDGTPELGPWALCWLGHLLCGKKQVPRSTKTGGSFWKLCST
jgi:hypothetical protein